MTWQQMHEVKQATIDTLLRVVTVARKLKDYAAIESLLQAARVMALAKGHPSTGGTGSTPCVGGGEDGACPVCRAVHFIEAALQEVNPDPEWQPRLDPDMPRIILPGSV